MPMKFFEFNQSGDTIVEVVISITILSLALVTAYALGTSALRASEAVNYRTEALALANSQVELLKNVVATGGNQSPYKTATKYCITFDQVQRINAPNWNVYCQAFDGHNANASSIFSVSDTYISGTVDVNVQWPDSKSPSGTANLDVYYQ